MPFITIRRARTWHYRKMRPCIEQSSGPVSLLPSQSCPDCITNTSGYDFRKGHLQPGLLKRVPPFDFRGPSPWGLFCIFRMANVSGGLYPLSVVALQISTGSVSLITVDSRKSYYLPWCTPEPARFAVREKQNV